MEKKMVGWLMAMSIFCIICTIVCRAQDVESQQVPQQLQKQQQCQIRLEYTASSSFYLHNNRSMTGHTYGKFFIHNQNETDIQSWRLQFKLMDDERILSQQDIISNNINLVAGGIQNNVVLEWQADNETNYIKKGGQARVDWISRKEFSGKNFNLSTPSQIQFSNLQNCQQTSQFDDLMYGYVGEEDSKIQVWFHSMDHLDQRQEIVYLPFQYISFSIFSRSHDVYDLADLKLYYYFSGGPQDLQRIRAEDYHIICVDPDDPPILNCSYITFNIQTNISNIYSARNVVEIGFLEGAGQLINYQKQEKAQQKGLHAYSDIVIHFYILSTNPFRNLQYSNDFSYKPSPILSMQSVDNFTNIAVGDYVFNEKIPVFLNGQQIAGFSPWQQAEQDKLSTEGFIAGVTKSNCLSNDCRIHITYCCNDKKRLIGDFLSVSGNESFTLPSPPTSRSNPSIPVIIIVVVIVVLLCCALAIIIVIYKPRKQQNPQFSKEQVNKGNAYTNIIGGQIWNLIQTQLQIFKRQAFFSQSISARVPAKAKYSLKEQDQDHLLKPVISKEIVKISLDEDLDQYIEFLGKGGFGSIAKIKRAEEKFSLKEQDQAHLLEPVISREVILGQGELIGKGAFSAVCKHKAKEKFSLKEQDKAHLLKPVISKEFVKISLDEDLESSRQHLGAGHLGDGGFDKVFQAKVTSKGKEIGINTEYVTVKKSYMPCKDIGYYKEILKEAESMCALENPFIVKIYGAALCKEGEYWYPCIVMERIFEQCSLNNLFKKKQETHEPYQTSLEWKLDILIQIAKGVEYLHSQNVIHQDLESDNILVYFSDGVPKIKISNFGLSKFKGGSKSTSGKCGTLNYMAPEQFDGHVAKSSDIWGLGVIMQECLVGETPWQQLGQLQIAYEIIHQKTPELENLKQMSIPDELYKLIVRCWRFDKQERPTASQILKQLEQIKQYAQAAQS